MQNSSLKDSPSSNKLNEQIYHNQITKQHLQEKNDKLLQYLDELLEASDPKEKYKKIVENRMAKQKQLQEDNMRLIKQNLLLKDYLKIATQKVKRMNERVDLSPQKGDQSPQKEEQMQIQSPSSPNSKPSSQQQPFSQQQLVDIKTFTPQYQKYIYQRMQQMHSDAQQIAVKQNQSIRKSLTLLQLAFQKLEKLVQLQKMTAKMEKLDEDSRDTVVVSREKYEKLLDYYVSTIVSSTVRHHQELQTKTQNPQAQGIKQFSPEEHEGKDQLTQLQREREQYLSSLLTNPHQLQNLFAQLAKKFNLHRQWQAYLTYRKQQAESYKQQVDSIISGTRQVKQKLLKNINSINDSTISFPSNQMEQSTALSIIESNQNQIQDMFFLKLQNLIQKLQFKPAERQLFSRFNKKRELGRLFDLDEILYKFKSKQDLTEISEHYTNYLIRTVNVLVMKMMEALAEKTTDNLNPEKYQFPWLITKLDIKSNEVKTRLLQALQKQFSLYLEQKHPSKLQDPLKQRKVVQPIREGVFDENKQLQKELIKVVMEYRDVLQSCVANCNRKTVVKLW